MSEGRSRWRVQGAKQDTGEPVNLIVESRNKESAERAAQKSGVLVSSVEPEPIPYAVPDPQSQMVYVDEIRKGAAFSFGFYAFFGMLVGYLIVAIVAVVILHMLGVLVFPGR